MQLLVPFVAYGYLYWVLQRISYEKIRLDYLVKMDRLLIWIL